jgi:MFS family permease
VAEPGTEPTSVLDRRWRSLTLGLPLVVTLFAFDNLGVTTVMPRVARDLHGLRLYGWSFSAFTLASMVGLVLAGHQADRRGPARSLGVGLVLFVIGLVVTATASDMPVVVAGRALQGLGSGSFGTTMYVVIGRVYPPDLRARMFAVLSSAWVLPSLVGPALAGLVSDAFGWRPVFLGLAVLAPLPIVLTVPRIQALETGAPPLRPTERAGTASPLGRALVVVLGVGLLLAGLTATSWPLAAVLGVAGLGLGGPGLVRLLPQGTLRVRRGVPAAVLLRGVLNLAFFGTDAFIPLFLIRLHHVSAAVAGLPLTAGALTWTASSWTMERVRSRLGPAQAAALAVVTCAVGVAGTLLALHWGPGLVVAAASWAVAGSGMGIAFTLVSVTVVDGSAPGAEGQTAAALSLSDALGTALGAGVGGALVALVAGAGWNLSAALSVQFGLNAVVALGCVFIGRRLVGITATTTDSGPSRPSALA